MCSDRDHGLCDSVEIREGVIRVETRALNQETAQGQTSLFEPDGRSRIFHALLAEDAVGHEPAKAPDRLA